jgi:hypothetical protein
MGVGILDRHTTMGGPAGMSDSNIAGQILWNDGLEVLDPPHLLVKLERVSTDGDPCGIIATILQASKPIEKDWGRLSLTDVSNDSAHISPPVRSVTRHPAMAVPGSGPAG